MIDTLDDDDSAVYFVLGYNGNKIFFKVVSNTKTEYKALNKNLSKTDVTLHLKVPHECATREISKIMNEAARKPLSKEEVFEIFGKSKGELK